MGVYEQIKQAFQDIIAPEIKIPHPRMDRPEIRERLAALEAKVR